MTEEASMRASLLGSILCGVMMFTAACGTPDATTESASADERENPGAGVTDAVVDRAREIGEGAALALADELFGQLSVELAERGPIDAIEFCSAEAVPATGRVAAAFEDGLDIKRTTFLYRNPENEPDAEESDALRYFERAFVLETEPPDFLVQKVSDREYRYYKPLVVVPPCLACHGDPDAMDPELLAKIAELYPEDHAMGYETGNFRGVIRVSIPASMVEEDAD